MKKLPKIGWLVLIGLWLSVPPGLIAGQTQDQIMGDWITQQNSKLPGDLQELIKKDLIFRVSYWEKWEPKPSKAELLRQGVPDRVAYDLDKKKNPELTLADWKVFSLEGFKLLIAEFWADPKKPEAGTGSTHLYILKNGTYSELWNADACSTVRLMKPYKNLPPLILCYQSGCGSGMSLTAYTLKRDGTLLEVEGDLGGWYPMQMMGYVTDWNLNMAFVKVKGDELPELVLWSGVMDYPEGLKERIEKATDFEDSMSVYHLDRFDVYKWAGEKFVLRGTFYKLPEERAAPALRKD